jgi:glycolate oxidase FAD binding subunit
MDALHPKTPSHVAEAVRWAAAEKTPLEVIGQGTKRAFGRPVQTTYTLDCSGLTGITLFEPDELVLSARAGTPLATIREALEEANQEFQFEPADLGPLFGKRPGRGTLGGMLSTNISGPRRLKSGSARDHVLGVNAVSGRGETFKSGGRVVKNVTGYDLSKGLTGAFGTLAVLTDITMKVLPKSETEATLVLHGLSDEEACAAMAKAMGSSGEVSGAAHLPAGIEGKTARTVLRLDGFETSVSARMNVLSALFGGEQDRLDAATSRNLWATIRDALPFAENKNRVLWRISCTPGEGYAVARDITSLSDARVFFDWQGGLLWLEMPDREPQEGLVRSAIAANGGGHATLIRAEAATRAAVEVFQPQPVPLAALTQRYRENFDPHGVLNPGRMNA